MEMCIIRHLRTYGISTTLLHACTLTEQAPVQDVRHDLFLMQFAQLRLENSAALIKF
jgi:hypothetical protein